MADQISQNINNSILGYLEYLKNLNQSATEVVGIDLLYFRAIPHENGESLIFHEYTLVNVDCQKSIKGIVKNPEYANGFEVDLFGVKYDSPLQIQFDLNTWNSVFGNTMPQKDDIVFVPVLNRLFEVSTSTPIYTFVNQQTAWQVDMVKYTPKAYRAENEQLAESIQESTNSIESLFGEAISDQIADITDKQDFSPYNSTSNEGDWFKEVSDYSNIVSQTLEFNGYLISNGYYDMSSEKSPVVTYKNSEDFINPNSDKPFRFFSCWFSPKSYKNQKQNDLKNFKLYNKVNRMSQFATYCSGNYSIGQSVVISKGTILRLPGTIINKEEEKGYYLIEIPTSEVLKANKKISNWNESGLKIESANGNMILLSGLPSFNIRIEGNKILKIQIGNISRTYSFYKPIENGWYGLTLSLGPTSNGALFDSNGDLIEQFELGKFNEEVHIEEYHIDPSGCLLAHIRLYEFETGISDTIKMRDDLLRLHTSNASRIIINDKPEIPNKMEYMGQIR